MKKLFKNATVLSMTGELNILSNASLIVEDGIIKYIGSDPAYSNSFKEIIDLKNKLVMPGLVNTHSHGAMSLLRGFGDDLPLKIWLEEKMWPLEMKYGDEQVKAGTALAIIEMIKCGITCFADMYNLMENVAEVVEEAGIRALLSRGIIGLCSEHEQKIKLNQAVQFAEEWNNQAEGRIKTMLSPHAIYTCSPKFIEEISAKAYELNIPIHTHLSETESEVMNCLNMYHKTPVEHLRDLGVFKNSTLIAHAVHVNDNDIEILLEHGVKVSHNPSSNLKLGSGVAPITKMLSKGIRPSLGTDSAASNNSLDILREMRLAALLHKGVNLDPTILSATTALKMATIFGAESLFIDDMIGTLEVGKKADFITIDLTAPHVQPLHNITSNLVYAVSSSDVTDVYVDGKPLMINRECTTLDEEKIKYETIKSIQQLGINSITIN